MACRGTPLPLSVLFSLNINLPFSASLNFYCLVKNEVRNVILTAALSWKSSSIFSTPLFCSSHEGTPPVQIQTWYTLHNVLKFSGPGSSVAIPTELPDWTVRGSNPGGGRDFPHLSRPALRPTQPPVQWVPGLSRGLGAAGVWRWPLTPSSAEV